MFKIVYWRTTQEYKNTSVKIFGFRICLKFQVSALIWVLTVLQKLSAPQAGIELIVSSVIKLVLVIYIFT